MTFEKIRQKFISNNEGLEAKMLNKTLVQFLVIGCTLIFFMFGVIKYIFDNPVYGGIAGFVTLGAEVMFLINTANEEEGYDLFGQLCKFWWLIIILMIAAYICILRFL